MLDRIALLRDFFRKKGFGFEMYMKKAQREEIRAKRLALVHELKLDKMSMWELRNFIEGLCPVHNYLFCLCMTCSPVDYCAEDPCAVCDGPVTECELPDDEEVDTEEKKE
jgi:hypothetical protein